MTSSTFSSKYITGRMNFQAKCMNAVSEFHPSLRTDAGENAGTHTAMYSAPSAPGVEYCTHSPAAAITA
jgi:hypothetical protein